MTRESLSQTDRNAQTRPENTDLTIGSQLWIPSSAPVELDLGPVRNPYRAYELAGPQMEPEAAYWTQGARALPRTITIHSVLLLTSDPGNTDLFIPPYPKSQEYLEWEIAELSSLQSLRDDPEAIAGDFPYPGPSTGLPTDFRDTTRHPLSEFITCCPVQSGGAAVRTRARQWAGGCGQDHLGRSNDLSDGANQMTGRTLARMFEHDTPGMFHRWALNSLFGGRTELSPPRQARVWMVLEVAIYSALIATWHYKWAADPTAYAYRQRPFEYDQNANFQVLFDSPVDDSTQDPIRRPWPFPSPGTPRSPSYPSGHSAAAYAASDVLAYFFPEEREELEMLANNIGMARLWAGVHWRSDHAAGRRLGRAVAARVLEQLDGDCIPPYDDPAYSLPGTPAPDPGALRQRAVKRRAANPCAEGPAGEDLTDRRDWPNGGPERP